MIDLSCVDFARAKWVKSSHSGGGQDCVEVARNLPGLVAVRDSKDPDGPTLVFSPEQWRAFTGAARDGRFRPLR